MIIPKYMTPPVNIKVNDTNCIPKRINPSDAGADLVAAEYTFMERGKRTLVKTGVYAEIPVGHVGLLFPRSGLSKLSVVMTNSVGVIDSDYRGEIMASLMYIGEFEHHSINKYERIVQLVVVPIVLPEFIVVESLSSTARDTGGFGSTGAV